MVTFKFTLFSCCVLNFTDAFLYSTRLTTGFSLC